MENSGNEQTKYTSLTAFKTFLMLIRFRIFVVIILLYGPSGLFGQEQILYSTDAEQKFSDALILFKNGHYGDALNEFLSLVGQPQTHQRTTAAYLMAAKTYFRLNEYRKSVTLLQTMIAAFPESKYLDDAHYSLGIDFFMIQKYREAADELIHGLEITQSDNVTRNARSLLETIVAEKLNSQLCEDLISGVRHQDTKDFLTITLAEKLYNEGDFVQSREYLDNIVRRQGLSHFAERARKLQERIPKNTNVSVGVLLPLLTKKPASAVKILAEEILFGITHALKEYHSSSTNTVHVVLDVRDTERDSARSQTLVQEFASKQDVVAILGPVFSNIAAACAPVANKQRIPVISPTATANNIAGTGPFVFQASPDNETRGKAMARYAVQKLGYLTLAVLAPDDPASIVIAESFSKEAQLLGAKIVASERYNRDTSDLRDQFMNIRKAGSSREPQVSFAGRIPRSDLVKIVNAGADASLVDSIRARNGSIGVTQLFGARGRHIADSLHLKLIFPETTGDNIEIPILGIQGIFVPVANADDIGIVSSQLKYFNIQTQLLGNTEWYDPVQLESHRRDTNGAIFISDFYADESDSSYATLAKSSSREMKKQPTKYMLFGYDTMRLLLDVIGHGATSREGIAARLAAVSDFHGIHSRISLVRGRVNSYLHVLRYNNGQVRQIAEISVD